MPQVPEIRITPVNGRPHRPQGRFILYWMVASRRTRWNFGLDRAVEWAQRLGKPLLILEPLRLDYPWASERLHRFVVEGMSDNHARLQDRPALYYPYVERTPGAGRGLLEALARLACVIVTDEFPTFFLPAMIRAAGRRVPVRLEQVDSNGLLPLRAADRAFDTAFAFRRHLQGRLPAHLETAPRPDPFRGKDLRGRLSLPRDLTRRWPKATARELQAPDRLVAGLPFSRPVGAVPNVRGGSEAARSTLRRFLRRGLPRYDQSRNNPDEEVSSGLSPYLHFGHLSAHEIFAAVGKVEDWAPERLGRRATGKRRGWWGLSAAAEAFLDQLVTWRELGFNFCHHRRDHDRIVSLPDWARRTLEKHADDPRPHRYGLGALDAARTHDPVWNAAQRQLRREGRIHNYLRMLWGKKILEWTASPEQALRIMIELNNRYALDGRDPNSYTGILWTLGRHDRPWGPERPVFGTVRYMSSENTRRKLDLRGYLCRYGPGPAPP